MNNISLQQIEIFLTVARYRSISKAARSLYISQPAVSKWLREMESTLGKELFIRDNKGVSLSADGELFYAEMDILYHRFRIMLGRIVENGSDGKEAGALRIGSLHEPHCMNSMVSFIENFSQGRAFKTPNELYNFQELRDNLQFDELDLVFTLSYDIAGNDEFATIPLMPIEQFFLIPSCWEAFGDGRLLPGRLAGKTLFAETRSGGDAALAACRAHGAEPACVKYGPFLLSAAKVARGEGFAIWGKHTPEPFSKRILRVPFSVSESVPPTFVAAAWRKDDGSEAVRCAKEVLGNLQSILSEGSVMNKNGADYRW